MAFKTIQNYETVSGTVQYRDQDLPDIYRTKPVLITLGKNGTYLPWP